MSAPGPVTVLEQVLEQVAPGPTSARSCGSVVCADRLCEGKHISRIDRAFDRFEPIIVYTIVSNLPVVEQRVDVVNIRPRC